MKSQRLSVWDLARIREKTRALTAVGDGGARAKITVHMGTCGIAAGAREVMAAVQEAAAAGGLPGVLVTASGCAGLCNREPMATVEIAGRPPVKYGRLTAARIRRILDEHVGGGRIVTDFALAAGRETEWGDEAESAGPLPSAAGDAAVPSLSDVPFFGRQRLIVLRNRGRIDPERIDDCIACDGYQGLARALTEMTPESIIAEIHDSGLRGRGGAGFPTGRKWAACRRAAGSPKYIVCNGDEGDPGAFMDRSVLEADPHAVLEGMIIGGRAIGAERGFLYIRDEYPLAIERIDLAIRQARAYGLLGTAILGSAFDFDVEIVRGAGAFVSGEETALLASIEGERAFPRQRPPYPAERGLWGRPTVINNVETWANVPAVLRRGAAWFAGLGTATSKGTKIFSLVGKIANTGLVEVPMGITLREIVHGVGGGVPGGRAFKAVQIGGPSGGCIPAELLDLPVDYESLTRAGAMMGSGGLIVMDEDTCMVDIALYFLRFTTGESCGKCAPCRIGTRQMADILARISRGEGRPADLDTLERLAATVQKGALCGLGQTAPNPVLSTLRYFRDEYRAHIEEKRCPALVCKPLLRFDVDPAKCVGCLLCLKSCPVNAIAGERRKVHVVDQAACIRCGTCLQACPAEIGAVVKSSGARPRPAEQAGRPVQP